MPGDEAPAAASDEAADILQFKIWLKGLSPMIWRRVQVSEDATLRELHGIFQLTMGWEGIHLFSFDLRAVRYGSHELGMRSPDESLGDLQLRKGARFAYEYDLNIPWDHEVRLEDRFQIQPRRHYPYCVDGHGACPPEDCGGPAGFLERRDASYSCEAFDDLTRMADFINEVVLKERFELRRDTDLMEELRDVLERMQMREAWKGRPFARKGVNDALKKGEHLELMHQQW
ncbi:plasmid pRiA4b ORF-3 family protein [Novosphingobium sp. Rr 2-17]|uniref:plasmid pRiA4b ORF-3 family protein n=1 Tax=Novosphingobium sp. Rr 2-17 TaxID=555793 RepID=UPI0002EBA475|nr:plasmid pRiA4b ORF-3 family protein [Novosphingobium sp. Rr 2-17]